MLELSDKLDSFKKIEICYPEFIQKMSNKITHHNQ